MPQTINGIGTHYYGKGNHFARWGACKHCGQQVLLESFDTTTYFVFIFVPLLPLGKKRVLDMCPSCTRHHAVPLRQWEQMKSAAVEQMHAAMHEKRHEAGAALEAIGAACAFQDAEDFEDVAVAARELHAGNAEVLQAIGDGFSFFGRHEPAAEAYSAALQIESAPETRRALAVAFVYSQRPEEAEAELNRLSGETETGDASTHLLIGMGYQVVGRHSDALRLFKKASDADPDLERDKSFAKLRKQSEKLQGTEKPIRHPELVRAKPKGEAERSPAGMGARIAALTGPAIVVVALVIYAWAAFAAGNAREVWLANGIDRSYTVEVNGEEHSIAPHSVRKIVVPEGRVVVEDADPAVDLPRHEIIFETPFWSRPFDSTVYVINPDEAAVLQVTVFIYSQTPREGGEPELFLGRAFHSIDDIDYVFENAPPSLRVSSDTSVMERRELSILVNPPISYVSYLAGEWGKTAEFLQYLKSSLKYRPDDADALSLLSETLGDEGFIEWAGPRLEEVPPPMALHSVYQQMMIASGRFDEVRERYARMLEEHPGEPGVQHLNARVLKDRRRARELMESAASGPAAPQEAVLYLCQANLASGRFDEAWQLAQRLREQSSRPADILTAYMGAADATGHHEEMLAFLDASFAQYGQGEMFGELQRLEIDLSKSYALARLGRLDEIAAIAAKLRSKLEASREWNSPDLVEALLKDFRLVGPYVSGQEDGLAIVRERAEAGDVWAGYVTALHEGDSAAAKDSVDSIHEAHFIELNSGFLALRTDYDDYLLVSICARLQGDDDLANEAIFSALENLNHTPGEALFLEILSDDGPLDVEAALALPMSLYAKKTALVVLAQLHPEHSAPLLDLARKLNFQVMFPHYYLDAVISETMERAHAGEVAGM